MLAAAVFLPLLGALLAGILGHWLGSRFAQWTTCLTMALSTLCGIVTLHSVSSNSAEGSEILVTWIHSGDIAVDWALRLDSLSAIMVFTVTLISTMIHIYAIGYMAHDRSITRFMAYLSLFTFFMLALVTADNLVQLFFGWEGVGFASYLLIGFWYERPSANAAAIKAFVVNRVSDFSFILGILATFVTFGSTSFDMIFPTAPDIANQHISFLSMQLNALEVICLLLFIGAMGKSAQLGLHVWLPDAMEGPTPVSALIHAATMVTAGVFLMARLSPLLELAPITSNLIVIIGASTALFAATVGLVQNDIKRVIAYSTCSQLGYMFFAAGLGAYTAAIFHLVTHAFFQSPPISRGRLRHSCS